MSLVSRDARRVVCGGCQRVTAVFSSELQKCLLLFFAGQSRQRVAQNGLEGRPHVLERASHASFLLQIRRQRHLNM